MPQSTPKSQSVGSRAPGKPEKIPAGPAAEPSTPSDAKPTENPKDQLTNAQEENPQVIAHTPGKQAKDTKHKTQGGGVDEKQKSFAGTPKL